MYGCEINIFYIFVGELCYFLCSIIMSKLQYFISNPLYFTKMAKASALYSALERRILVEKKLSLASEPFRYHRILVVALIVALQWMSH